MVQNRGRTKECSEIGENHAELLGNYSKNAFKYISLTHYRDTFHFSHLQLEAIILLGFLSLKTKRLCVSSGGGMQIACFKISQAAMITVLSLFHLSLEGLTQPSILVTLLVDTILQSLTFCKASF